MKIKILCNDSSRKNFFYEHGLSILINDTILFDTGQTDIFIKNGEKLHVDFQKIEKIFISHGHYDHVGGLFHLQNKTNATVFIHKKALIPKFSAKKFAGIPYDWNKIPFKVVYTDKDTVIDNIHIINSIPTDKEIINKKFNVNGKQDLFDDEINLIINNVLFTGCAHKGIENILKYTMKNYKIKAVVGGFHLSGASSKRIKKIIALFKSYNLEIFPLHCTGSDVIKLLKEELNEKCIELKAGDEWRLI
ncbi:MBL fold metallo-hydrolase [Thermosipho ferrireducens]|uniref:MBL fold metallo-hydrolase n=1 Tax=Thermosipho ferrireducens TaxID=2571116 RepID=A0ABX7S9X3_9BACT|nr:MBL fold metallo-hydrolase [Thermosipho ferrireducens]QTA38040.1 MBL fold metallo-hydrolase [Thermosipho ferrireducens]